MGNTTPKNDQQRRSTGTGVIGFIVRFVVAAIVLMVTAYFVPGFKMRGGFSTAIIAALVIAAADFLIEKLFKFDASPLGRGISGFLVSAGACFHEASGPEGAIAELTRKRTRTILEGDLHHVLGATLKG